MIKKTCLLCNKNLTTRFQVKYCSNKCQKDWQYSDYIKNWKNNKKVETKNISKYLKRYIIEKYGEKCDLCRWHKTNKITNKIPLEMNHIDGNSLNNDENNLQLLCPNCHSLTPNFRNLNKGNGRKWRNKNLHINM